MTRTIDDLVETLRKAKDRGRKCTLLIGAGCSVKAGIPTAAGFVDIIRSEYPQAYNRAGEKSYPASMSQLALSERRDLIARYVDKAKINWAHIAIAQLMKSGYVDRVLTTNFDSLIVRACALLGLFPAAYDFAVSQVLKPGDLPDMAIFYLHGQRTGFVLMNTKEECEDHSKLLAPLFDNAGQGRVWLVVGYSGENDPVFDHLAATKTFDNNLYWVGYKQDEPKKHVREKLLVEGKYAFHTSGYDADDFFVTMAQKLGCFPPDFVAKPFPYLESLLGMVVPYNLPGAGMEMDLLESVRRKIQAAMDHDEDLRVTEVPVAEHEKPMAALVEEARQLLVAGEYERVLAIQPNQRAIADPELSTLVSWAHFMRGNILYQQGEVESGPGRDQLWSEAGKKYAAALAIKPDSPEALNNWGNVLATQAGIKTGADADRLWLQAEEKYAAALAIKPDKHEALYNWGVVLAAQAGTKTGAEADRLWLQAEEKYTAVLAIKPNMHEALLNWGVVLATQAGIKTGAEADRLWLQAEEKYTAVLAIKPDVHQVYNSRAAALLARAEVKSKTEAEALIRQAEENSCKAELLVPGAGAYNLACIEARRGNEDSC
jgi:tetratricopeptide (TPR) repeat protein